MYHRHIKAVLSKLLNRLFYFSFLFFVPNMPLALHSFSLHPETRQVHNAPHDAILLTVLHALLLPWSARMSVPDSSFCEFLLYCSNSLQPVLPDKPRKYHPDLNPNDATAKDKFQAINEANEVLSDPEKRKK